MMRSTSPKSASRTIHVTGDGNPASCRDKRPGQETTASDPIVKLVNVQKSYDGENLVVADLNLNIRRGEFLTMLGPSGSGKTTTLMMLAGFETATEGEIFVNGSLVNKVPPNKRGIGMVFQNYALFPHMSVAENLAFPLRARHRSSSDIAALVKDALDMVELGGYGGRRPAQLSGGQQQRVALARALIFGPELVLMDEPLGALDKNLRTQMQYEIKQLHERIGATIVYVTHDQDEALTMSDRIAVFKDGIIQQLAPPIDMYERPTNRFVAEFVGENNILLGTITDLVPGGLCRVKLDSGEMVQAAASETSSSGSRTVLSLRPERIRVDPDGAQGIAGSLDVVVKELVYHGDHLRARVRSKGGAELIIKGSNHAFHSVPGRGEAVKIGWLPADCRALEASH